jgi:hypothetical protein
MCDLSFVRRGWFRSGVLSPPAATPERSGNRATKLAKDAKYLERLKNYVRDICDVRDIRDVDGERTLRRHP